MLLGNALLSSLGLRKFIFQFDLNKYGLAPCVYWNPRDDWQHTGNLAFSLQSQAVIADQIHYIAKYRYVTSLII